MTEFRSDIVDELERLHAAATQGEWRMIKEDDYYAILHPANEGETIAFCPQDTGRKQKSCAAFIVAAHNHLPALLATLREMREALEQIRDAGHENGNICDVELADGRDCDCTRSLADAALDAARERLGAK